MERMKREERLARDGSSRPVRPGEPAHWSPRLSSTTLSNLQKTPGKLHGSEVKSHGEKKVLPGTSRSYFLSHCNTKKSRGSSNAYTGEALSNMVVKMNSSSRILDIDDPVLVMASS